MLKPFLRRESRVEYVGGFSSPVAAIGRLEDLIPDVALVDINMPEMDGITCARAIKSKMPEVEVVIITGLRSVTLYQQAADAGASEFLEKPFQKAQLIASIYFAFARHGRINLKGQNPITEVEHRAALSVAKGLTDREIAVWDCLGSGMSNKDIAGVLNIPQTTADWTVRTVCQKLNAKTKGEAISMRYPHP